MQLPLGVPLLPCDGIAAVQTGPRSRQPEANVPAVQAGLPVAGRTTGRPPGALSSRCSPARSRQRNRRGRPHPRRRDQRRGREQRALGRGGHGAGPPVVARPGRWRAGVNGLRRRLGGDHHRRRNAPGGGRAALHAGADGARGPGSGRRGGLGTQGPGDRTDRFTRLDSGTVRASGFSYCSELTRWPPTALRGQPLARRDLHEPNSCNHGRPPSGRAQRKRRDDHPERAAGRPLPVRSAGPGPRPARCR